MPTTITGRSEVFVATESLWYGFYNSTQRSVEVFRHQTVKPDTVKRPKPKVLDIRTQTPRVVSSMRWTMLSPSSYTDNVYYGYEKAYQFPAYPTDHLWDPFGETGFHQMANRMLAEIKDQNVNLSVMCVELGKTTDMVANLAKDVYRVFHKLRSGRAIKDFVRSLKKPRNRADRALARKWLEANYGWQPAMMEISGLATQIHKSLSLGMPIHKTLRAPLKHTDGGKAYTQSWKRSFSGSQIMRARYVVTAQGLKTLAECGITNPAAVVWELVPYSFVIDWVIDIGGYLALLDALNGVSGLEVVYNYGFNMTWERTTSQAGYNGNGGWQEGKDIGIWTFSSRSAVMYDLTPTPPFYDPHIGVKRAISAAALLRNLKG